jgi:hypothetical protein
MEQRRAVAAKMAGRYQRAGKKEKGQLLDEFVKLTEYQRAYARRVLGNHGRRMPLGGKTVLIADARQRTRSPRPRVYDEQVAVALIRLWKMMDYLCGKRLQPALAEWIPALERHGELRFEPEVRAKLLRISAATIDRLLQPERRKHELRGRSRTKPGTLLKHQIPIRTHAQWDENRPGFVEIDLVGHDGGSTAGDYCQSLNLTDIATTWTEPLAVPNKAQQWVFEALQEARKNLPFDLLGIDSDNGAEFINHQLEVYCRQEKITFTRSRPSRKNDNCFVEQKNYSIIRRAVGYGRYDTPEQLALLRQLYRRLRLYTNFFLPTMKLKSKVRHGSRVTKTYDEAQTPYQRVLASAHVSKPLRQRLRKQYPTLNPAALKREIDQLQARLQKTLCRLQRPSRAQPKKFWQPSVN